MLIVYDSLTGLVKKTALALSNHVKSVNEIEYINEPCLLITRSIGFGNIPDSTRNFVEKNLQWIKAVAVSGNKNWGLNYGACGDKLQAEYNIPLLLKFEATGMKADILFMQQWIKENGYER